MLCYVPIANCGSREEFQEGRNPRTVANHRMFATTKPARPPSPGTPAAAAAATAAPFNKQEEDEEEEEEEE